MQKEDNAKTPLQLFEVRIKGKKVKDIIRLDSNDNSESFFEQNAKVHESFGFFSDKIFESTCILESCYFIKGVVCTNPTFKKYLSFGNSVFERDFRVVNLVADEKVNFKEGYFNQAVEFANCDFYSSVIFDDVQFKSSVKFENCKFGGDVNFVNVKFKELATFETCTFEGKVSFDEADLKHIHIENCTFKQGVDFSSKRERKTIPQITIHHTSFNEEVVFYARTFEKANFYAVTFNGIADFYDTSFNQPVNFAKTKFLDTCNFVKACFNGIAVFNLTVVGRNMVLRDAQFEKGLNLATIDFVGEGMINSFGVKIIDFKADADAEDINLNENWIKISSLHFRETYRILKHETLKQNNKIQALEFHAKEMEAYRQELISTEKWYNKDRIILGFNRLTNDYGLDWGKGLKLTIGCSVYFFLLYYLSLEQKPVVFTLDTDFKSTVSAVGLVLSYYTQFFNPTHWVTFMKEYIGNWSVFIDLLSRPFIALGIYQTIQAFRKYGRF
jgi:uncharacterized protein YjbI with pentapeptide repeats